jgi:hypothetical protein
MKIVHENAAAFFFLRMEKYHFEYERDLDTGQWLDSCENYGILSSLMFPNKFWGSHRSISAIPCASGNISERESKQFSHLVPRVHYEVHPMVWWLVYKKGSLTYLCPSILNGNNMRPTAVSIDTRRE